MHFSSQLEGKRITGTELNKVGAQPRNRKRSKRRRVTSFVDAPTFASTVCALIGNISEGISHNSGISTIQTLRAFFKWGNVSCRGHSKIWEMELPHIGNSD